MRRAQSTTAVAAVLAGIIVGAALVFATPTLLGYREPTSTVTNTSVSTSVSTQLLTPTQQTVTQTETDTQTETNIQDFTTTQITTIIEETGQPGGTVTVTETVGNGETTTQFENYGVADLVQSCGAFGNPNQTASCSLANPVAAGDLLAVVVAEVPLCQEPVSQTETTGQTTTVTTTSYQTTTGPTCSTTPSLSDSLGDSFTLVGMTSRPDTTYEFYVFTATARSSGNDAFELTGPGNYPFLLVHELQGVTQVVGFSSGQGTSQSPAVTAYTVPSGSFVLSAVFVLNNDGTMAAAVGAGSGYTLLANTFGVSEEYGTVSGSTTSPFAMSASIPWADLSVAFG